MNVQSLIAKYIEQCFDDVKIIKTVATGGQGSIHLGVWNNQVVAVKHVRRPFTEENDVDRGARELAVIMRLRHPNIVECYQNRATGDFNYYMVMQYIEKNLGSFIGKLPLSSQFLLARDICSSLMHIHKLKIVHRDLKPENILVDDSGKRWTAKLCDFGVCAVPKQEGKTISSWAKEGTRTYQVTTC